MLSLGLHGWKVVEDKTKHVINLSLMDASIINGGADKFNLLGITVNPPRHTTNTYRVNVYNLKGKWSIENNV